LDFIFSVIKFGWFRGSINETKAAKKNVDGIDSKRIDLRGNTHLSSYIHQTKANAEQKETKII
jgi:hypothetical protein